MESNKRPDKLSDDELLKLLENPELRDNTSLSFLSSNPIVRFIDLFNLQAGSQTVSCKLIHKLYKDTTKEALDYEDFRYELGKIFRIDRDHNLYLNLDKSKLNQYIIQILDKKPPEKNQAKVRTEIKNFLTKYELTPGNYYFEDFILYSLYKNLLSFDNFKKSLKNFLPYKLDKHNIYWFGISHDLKKFITEDEINNARKRNAKKEKIKKK